MFSGLERVTHARTKIETIVMMCLLCITCYVSSEFKENILHISTDDMALVMAHKTFPTSATALSQISWQTCN